MAASILELESRGMALQRGIHTQTLRLRTLDTEEAELTAALLGEQRKQATFAPPGSVLKREGAAHLAIGIKQHQKRVLEHLERELARCRRADDEASRVVAARREEINLLRKQAIVLNDDFLRRSNELDSCKMALAIRLEQANQIVRASQYVAEQANEVRAEAGAEREVWLKDRDVIVGEVVRILNLLAADAPARRRDQRRAAQAEGGSGSTSRLHGSRSAASLGRSGSKAKLGSTGTGIGGLDGALRSTAAPLPAELRDHQHQHDGAGGISGNAGDGQGDRDLGALGSGALEVDLGIFSAPMAAGDGFEGAGALDPAEEGRVKERVRKLEALQTALEQDEPRQMAQLSEWETAFHALTAATGQSDPEQLAARFLDDDAANFEVYANAAAADEEAAALQAQMVAIVQDIGRVRETADVARVERRNALQRELAATQAAAEEAERREREFGEQLRAASGGISGLFALLNCDEAADEWTAAARSASSSSAVGGTATTAWLLGEQSQAGGAAATGSGERPATNDAQRPISGKRGPGIGAGGAASGVRSPGGATATTRRAVGLAALLERTAEAAGEQPDSASSSAAPAPQDAWQLLQRAQAAGAGAAAAGALAVGPDGRRRSADGSPMDGHGALSPTSPGGTAASSMMMMASPPLLATRSLAEMAGLTGSMRGSGLKRLLSEGSLQPAASMTSGSGSGDGGANASGDAAAAEGGAPSPTTPTDSQRSASIDASFATGIAAVDAVTAGGHGTVPAHPHAAAASTASSTPSKGPGGARLSVAIQPLHTGSASSRGSTDVASPLPLMTPGSLAGRRVSTAAQQALLLQQQMQVAPPMSPVARSLGLEAQLRADARRAAAAPPVPGASLLAVMALLERRVTQVLQEFQSCVSGAISAAGADGHGADTAGAGVISEGEGSHALSRLAGVPAVRLSLAAAAVLAAANGGNGHTGAAEAAVQPSPNRSPRAAADTTATGDALFAATGGALQFMGPRGPRIERAADLHAFHIEPPSPDDVVLAGDVHAAAAALLAAGSAAAAAAAAAGAADAREELAALEGMQEKYALLRRNRRASLASIVDGVATAPPGPASAILALSAGSMPKVEARPGTVYAAAAAPDSADRLSRGQLHGRPLTTGTTTPGVPSRRESANDLSLAAAAAAMAAAGGEGEGVSPPGAGRASRHSIRSAGGSASGSASASGSPYGSVILPPPQESPMATMSTSGGGGGTSPSRGGARLHSRSGSPSGRAGTAGGVASGSSSPRLFPSPSSAGAGAAGIGLGGGLTSPAMSYILSNRSQDPSVGAAGAGAAAGNLASLLTRSRRGSAADSVVSQSGGFGALLGGRSGPGGAAGSGAAAAGMGLGPLQLNPAGSRALYLVERHAGAAAQALASGRPNSPLKPYVVGAGGPPSPLARAMPMPATFGDASASPSAATRSPGGGGMIEELEGAMRHEPVTVGILPAAFALGPGADGSASPGGSGAGTAGASPSTTIGGAGAVRVADRDGYEAWIRSRMATAAAAATAAGLDTAPGSAKKRKARGSSDAKAGKGSGSVLAALAPRAAAGAGASPGASPSGSNSSSRLPSLTPSNSARKAAPSPAAAGGLASSASAPALGTGYPSRIGLTSSEISDGGMSMTMTMGELPELLEGDHDGNDGGEAAAMRRGHGAGMSAGLHGIIPLTAAADALAPGAQAGGLASEMAAASSARRAKYPKSLPSGFKVASITSYAGAGSQHAYAQYSGNATAAARQRLQLAAAGFQPSGAAASAGTTAPQTSGRGPAAIAVPLDAATLRRDVRQRYAALGIGTGAQASAVGAAGEPSLLFGGPGVGDGQGIYGSTGSLPLAYGAAGAAAGGTSERRGSTAGGASGATVAMAVQLIKPGVFDESRHAEAQRLREQEREKSRRRASLASLENSLAKSRAKANQQIEAAERERDALRAVIAGDAPQAGYATSTYAAGGAGGIGGSAFGLADASEGMTLLTGGRRGEGYGYGEAAASSASLPIPPILRALQELQDRQRQKLAQLGGVAAPAPAVVAPAAAAAAKAPQAVKPAANLEAAAAEGKATDGDVGRAMPAPLAAAEHKEDDAGSDEKPISAADATAASAAAAVAAEAVAAAAAATAGDAGGRHDDDGVKPATAADLATASLPFSPGLPPGYIRLASGAVLALPGAEPGLVPGAVAAPAQTVALTAMQPVSGPEAAASGSPSGGAQIQAQTDRGSTSRSSSRASSSTASVRPPPGFALARAPSGQMVMVPAAALRAAQQSRAGSPGGSTGATSPQAASGSASGRATPQPPSDSSADAPPERG